MIKLKIKGLDCPSCATLLECELEDVGIKAKVNFQKEIIELTESDLPKVKKIIKSSGYTLLQS